MSQTLKGAIVCKSRYGAARQYAEWLGDRLDLPIFDPDTDTPKLNTYDYLLIGSSVYVGKMLIKKWLDHHKEEISTKKLFFFVVCATPGSEKDKQQKIIHDNIPSDLVDEQSIFFLPGRLTISKLSWRDRLLLRLGSRMEKDPKKKAAMQRDMDGMNVKYLDPMIEAAKALTEHDSQVAV